MDLRPLDDLVAVTPQLDPADMPGLAASGVGTIVCNRPDAENPPERQAAAMQAAAEAAGMAFVFNPVTMQSLSMPAVEEQADAIDGAAEGSRVVAYCASGTRSVILWALAMAGRMPADDILKATRVAGYDLEGLRPQIAALEAQR